MSVDKGLVSIIVPVYNVEKYLNECIDSILNQTLKDFELILVDDGSVDNSGAICDEYAKKYSNIKVLHQENQGQAAARNNGVKIASADWIMFVDSDDVIHPNLLEYLYRAVTESGSKMAVSERVEGQFVPDDFYASYSYVYCEEEINHSVLMKYYTDGEDAYWAPFPSIIKKEVLFLAPFPEGKIFEDNAIGCQFLYFAKKIAKIPLELYFYRSNPNGTMSSQFSIKKLDYLWALEYQIEFYKKIEFYELISKISIDLLETAFYYYEISIKHHKTDIQKMLKDKIRKILKDYSKFIVIDTRIRNKLLKIYHPFLFRIKKLIK